MGCIFSFLFHLLPLLQPRQSWSLVFLPPSLVPHTVCVCPWCFLHVSVGPQLSLWPSHPSCLDLTPLGSGARILGTGFSAQPLPARHIFQPVPGQPGQSGLIFNPCFHLTQQMLPKALGSRVLGSPPSCGVSRWGQDEEGRERACLPRTLLILGSC